MNSTLYYFYDPMCSWCYAFQPIWSKIKADLPDGLHISRVVGGLAADDDMPMDEELKQYIQQHWRKIQETVPGIQFNFEFWDKCKPRRSTYPACRAVIAAKAQGIEHEEPMVIALQKAFYLEARNPSDYETHIELAAELNLDTERFKDDLLSTETEKELVTQIRFCQELGVSSFPSLVMKIADQYIRVPHDYQDPEPSLSAIHKLHAPKQALA